MISHDSKAEAQLLETIAARFPYHDPKLASELMQRGWSISLNAAFCVLHELCRPPKGMSVTRSQLRKLIAEWAIGPAHPLKEPLLRCAEALIADEPLSWREGVKIIRRIGQHEDQRGALAIAYFASDSSTDEADAALNEAENAVQRAWDIQSD